MNIFTNWVCVGWWWWWWCEDQPLLGNQPVLRATNLDVEVRGLAVRAVHDDAHLVLDALEARLPRHALQLLVQVHDGADCMYDDDQV